MSGSNLYLMCSFKVEMTFVEVLKVRHAMFLMDNVAHFYF